MRRGTPARLVRGALLLAVAATACNAQSPPVRRSPSPSAAAPTTGPVGPTVSPGPTGTAAVVQAWLVHWVRAFVTLGQGVDQFRQNVRQRDQQAIAETARPLAGAAAQVLAALKVSRPFPPPVAPVADRMLGTLADVREQAGAVTHACPGDGCMDTAQTMYDVTSTMLDGFRSIFETAGVPIPEAS